MVLVVDEPATKVISSVLGMYDIIEEKVTTVESLKNRRQPLPELEVIYLVYPSAESVKLICQDFEGGKSGPLYGPVHLFFLTRVGDAEMKTLKACPTLIKRVKTFNEVNLNFIVTELNAFHLELPATFKTLYGAGVGTATPARSALAATIASKLVTVCATTNEYPHVRYRAGSSITEEIARLFQDGMNSFVASNAAWWYHGGQGHAERERATILLVDRADDPLSPLMHEFTYQAMAHDLLTIDVNGKVSYTVPTNAGKPETKEAFLGESDDIWKEFSNKHIAKVMEVLSERFKTFASTNSGAKLERKDADGKAATLSMAEMSAAIKAMPEYKETLAKMTLHIQLAQSCNDAFTKQDLATLAELEQTLATGIDKDDKPAKASKLQSDLIDAIVGIDKAMAMRLIMVYIISQQGIKDEEKAKLFSAAGLTPAEQATIGNLAKLGVTMQQQQVTEKKSGFSSMFRSTADKVRASGHANTNTEYEFMRYACNLKILLEQLCANRLSHEEYPSVLPMPASSSKAGGAADAAAKSVRRGGGNTRWGAGGGAATGAAAAAKKTYPGGRAIVFVVGGLCYSELRSCKEIMEPGGQNNDKEVVVGGTEFITPNAYLECLRSLSDP